MEILVVVLLVVALALFIAAGLGVPTKINLLAFGLAALGLALLLPHLQGLK